MLKPMALLCLLAAAPVSAALNTVGSVTIGPDRWGKKTWVSEDGAHYAQLLAKGETEIWFADGKRVAEARKGTFIYEHNALGNPEIQAVMGSDGRLAYARRVYNERGEPIGFAVVIGKEQGPTFRGIAQLVASPSGAHFAYLGTESTWKVLVDGRPVASHVGAPTDLSVDDAGRAVYLGNNDEGARYMFLSGKPLRPWNAQNLVLAPGWRSIAGKSLGGQEMVLVEDHLRYGPYSSITGIMFSADGAHVLFDARDKDGDRMFFDGKPYGPSNGYGFEDNAAALGAGRFGWFAKSGGQDFLFVDGKAIVPIKTPLSVGGSGPHYAAVGYADKGMAWAADGGLEEGPQHLLAGAKIVFDSPDEFHVLTSENGTARLSCLSFYKKGAESSTCMTKAKRSYKPYDEDEEEDREGVMMLRRAKVKARP